MLTTPCFAPMLSWMLLTHAWHVMPSIDTTASSILADVNRTVFCKLAYCFSFLQGRNNRIFFSWNSFKVFGSSDYHFFYRDSFLIEKNYLARWKICAKLDWRLRRWIGWNQKFENDKIWIKFNKWQDSVWFQRFYS